MNPHFDLDLSFLIGKRIKVSIRDKRQFIGMFHCVDPHCNLIIYETVEISAASEVGIDGGASRPLGDFAMIPGIEIVTVECWSREK